MPNHRIEISRLLKIHAAIASGEHPTIDLLVERCGVGARTIKRDIALLRNEMEAPIAVSRSRGRQGYYYTRPYHLAPEPFDEQEMLALSLSLQIADAFRNMPFVPAIKGALQKLREMGAGAQGQADPGDRIMLLAEPAPPENLATTMHFNGLLDAINRGQQVRLRYYTMSRDAVTERVFDPYHLYHYDGLWYVYGYCHLRGENRDFAVNRILQLHRLSTNFTPPSLEAIRHHLSSRFANITDDPVEVRIRFDAQAARRIRERIWHSSQQIEDAEYGACILAMTVTGLETVTRWLLSFGCHARPLDPPALVKHVQQEVEAMAAQFNSLQR